MNFKGVRYIDIVTSVFAIIILLSSRFQYRDNVSTILWVMMCKRWLGQKIASE